jgi:hypothetical protein
MRKSESGIQRSPVPDVNGESPAATPPAPPPQPPAAPS